MWLLLVQCGLGWLSIADIFSLYVAPVSIVDLQDSVLLTLFHYMWLLLLAHCCLSTKFAASVLLCFKNQVIELKM